MISSVLLLAALALAPVIGGGFDALKNGILQLLVLGGICCRLLSTKNRPGTFARVPGEWFIAAFLAFAVISTCASKSIYFSLNQFIFFATCLGAYLLSSSVSDDKRVAAAAMWLLLLSSLAVSSLGIRNYALDAGGGINFWRSLLGSGQHSRLFGAFINPSFFAGYLVLALPVSLGIYLVTRRTALVVLAGLAFVVDMLALMLTGAKFGIIAAVASLGLFFLLAIVTKALRRARFIRLLALCAVLTPLLVLFSAPVKSRIQAAESGGAQVHSTVFRVYTWQATMNMIAAQPWFGAGPGTYPITYPKYTIAGPTRHAHNSYLQVAAECGIPAAVVFLALLIALARSTLLTTIRYSGCSPDERKEAVEEPLPDAITWTDILPFSGWRLMNCALFAALFGSAVRNLVDSDWYISGISITFWVIAGVLATRSGAVGGQRLQPGKPARNIACAVCGVMILLTASSGLGDYYSDKAESIQQRSADEGQEVIRLYRKAAAVSPLAPSYHRHLAVWLGMHDGDWKNAYKQADWAIRLARNTSEGGWYAKAIIAEANNETPRAIACYYKALQYNPNSTKTLFRLAQIFREIHNTEGLEGALRRLLAIENSDYELVRGTPEIIDGTYAYAHAYFGEQYLNRHYYSASIREYRAAIKRLEQWRESGNMRDVQRQIGLVSDADARNLLRLLRDCYTQLAAAYAATGNDAEAKQALERASKVD